MATIDATVGGPSANSYITVADATTFLETQLHYTDWVDADAATQINALIEATRQVDQLVDWNGEIASDTQALRHPRKSLVDVDGRTIASTVIAPPVKNATALLALYMIASNRNAERADIGIESVSVAGAVNVQFSKRDQQKTIPEDVYRMLQPYGNVVGYTSFVPITRS